MLTADHVRKLLDYDPDTGLVRWRERPSLPTFRFAGRVAGTVHHPRHAVTPHIRIHVGTEFLFAHHVAFAWMVDELPIGLVDHKNGNGVDNRWVNLRKVTLGENIRARGKRRDNPSGFIGVYKVGQRWRATLRVNGWLHHLGTFATPESASLARDEEALRQHGSFARLNGVTA